MRWTHSRHATLEMAVLGSHDQDSILDSDGEEAWQQLRRQFELADGFWLGFVFCPSPRTVSVLRRRTGQILKIRARLLRTIRPDSPADFGNVLPALFESDSAGAGCIWIESMHIGAPTPQAKELGDWTSAWDSFLLRANERRDVMRRRIEGGLILAAPPEVKPRARDAAPDLWSVRSLVLELRSRSSEFSGGVHRDALHTQKADSGHAGRPSDTPVDVNVDLAEAEHILRRIEAAQDGSQLGLARILLRAADALLERGEARSASDYARKVVDVLRAQSDGAPLLADALSSLGEAARVDNDFAVALESIEESVAVRRRLLDTYGERPQLLRDLSLGLGRLGHVRRDAGDLAGATSAYEESLALRRRLLDIYGETPQSLRDLSISLGRLARVRRVAGDLAAATATFEESLALHRRRLDVCGETPQSLRDLSISLGRLGGVRREAGDLAAAAVAVEESLALRRRLFDIYGETPQSLRDLTVGLNRLGDVRREAGDLAAATVAFKESRALRRRLLDAYGETPQALRDLSVSLVRLGAVRCEVGEFGAATAAFEESLALRRRLLDAYGETPQALRDLSVSLVRLGDVRREAGEFGVATAAFEESLALRRRLLDAYGEKPQALRDLSDSLGKLGDVRREVGEHAAATAAFEESLALSRRLLEAYGETPQALRDLSISLARLGDARGEADELGAARAAYEEAALVLRQIAAAGHDQPPRPALPALLAIVRKLEHIAERTGDHTASDALDRERQAIEERLAASQE